MAKAASGTKRKLLTIDADVLRALEDMVRDGEGSLDDLADRALRDFLKKHGRPVTLREALRASTRLTAANDGGRRRKT